MSEISDRMSEFVRDHADFTIGVLALVILALCAVTWLWARQTRLLRRQLAQERAANRAVLPVPSDAVMAAVVSAAGNREVERAGRPVYSVAQRDDEASRTGAAAAPVVQDSLGWVLPVAAGELAAATPLPDPPTRLEDAPSEDPPTWVPVSPPTSLEPGAVPSASPAGWAVREPRDSSGRAPGHEPAGPARGTQAAPASPERAPAAASAAGPAGSAVEPNGAYAAWDAVTSPRVDGNGAGAGDGGDQVAYSAWQHAVDSPASAPADEAPAMQEPPPAVAVAPPVATWTPPAPNGSGPAHAANGAGPAHAAEPPRAGGETEGAWARPDASGPAAPAAEPAPTPTAAATAPAPAAPAWYRPSQPEPLPQHTPGDDASPPAPAAAPAPPVEAWTPQAPVAAPGPPTAAVSTGETAPDVLLVEDDENVSSVYRLLLESKGYSVRSATDGVAGLELAHARRPDLILLDVMMPRMNGILFLQSLRAQPELEALPVVVLSNFKEPRLVDRALALGALEYAVKAQTRPEALLNAMPAWIRGERTFAG